MIHYIMLALVLLVHHKQMDTTSAKKSVTILFMILQNHIARIALLCSLLTVTACGSYSSAELPEMDLTTIKGNSVSTKTTDKRVTLVSFWATSCKSCVKEMPELIKTYEEYSDKGFEVLAISMQYDPPAQLVAYTEQKGLPFPVIHDSYGDIASKFGEVNATPTAYLYNKAGKRINKTVGILDFKALHATLNQELS